MKVLKAVVIFCLVGAVLRPLPLSAQANPRDVQILTTAQMEFRRANYDKAAKAFRAYLRNHQRDYNTWNQLAAAYYHTGLPDTALLVLKKVQNQTTQKSYNLYYQGLCYDALENVNYAKAYYQYAARYQDEYASRAVFELLVIENNSKNLDAARYWADQYQKRFPQGSFIAPARAMAARLKDGILTPDAKGNEKPDVETARFKYNKLSLFNKPHFWFINTGFFFELGTQSNPKSASSPELTKELYQIQELKVNTGIGLGPYKQDDSEAYFGYKYFQTWGTDTDRLNTFVENPFDLNYIPFRGDLLEREHILFGYAKKKFPSNLLLSVYGSYEIARVGSTFFPSPDDQELQRVLSVSTTTLIIPSIGYKYYRDYETSFYLYLRKELNEENFDASNKTYSFLGDSNKQTYSYGLTHLMPIPQWNAKFTGEIFQYDFIFNDYFFDYTRTGILLSGSVNFLRFFATEFTYGMYTDQYILDRIKRGSCTPKADLRLDKAEAVTCKRTDTGVIYQVLGHWNISPFQRISGYYNHVENRNSTLKLYDKSRDRFGVSYTIAFPGVNRVSPFFERFGDTALTKDAE